LRKRGESLELYEGSRYAYRGGEEGQASLSGRKKLSPGFLKKNGRRKKRGRTLLRDVVAQGRGQPVLGDEGSP